MGFRVKWDCIWYEESNGIKYGMKSEMTNEKKTHDPAVVDWTHTLLRQGPYTWRNCVQDAHVKNPSVVENHKEYAEYSTAFAKL